MKNSLRNVMMTRRRRRRRRRRKRRKKRIEFNGNSWLVDIIIICNHVFGICSLIYTQVIIIINQYIYLIIYTSIHATIYVYNNIYAACTIYIYNFQISIISIIHNHHHYYFARIIITFNVMRKFQLYNECFPSIMFVLQVE